METHESYVNLKTAKLLKEAGFVWETFGFYGRVWDEKAYEDSTPTDEFYLSTHYALLNWNDDTISLIHTEKYKGQINRVSAPTLDIVQKWLREVKNWYVWTEPCKVTKPETSFPFHHISTEEWTTYVWYGIDRDGHCRVSGHSY